MLIRLTVFLILIALNAIHATSNQLHAKTNAPVYTSIPGIDCVINPFVVVDISSPVSGVIETLHVERSQQVTAGQELAQLESSVDRATVDLARYRADVESGVRLGKVNVKFDQLRKKRVQSLVDEENVSREIVDQVERDVQLSKWNLKEAEELATIRKFELLKAQEMLQQRTIKAPFDGYVLDTFKHRGEFVDDQVILRMAQLDPLVIEAIVPMEHFGQIHAGMYADVMPEILINEKVRGQVIAVDRIGDTASNTFGVKLSVANPGNKIPAGLKCTLKFIEMGQVQIDAEAKKLASRRSIKPSITLLDDSSIAKTDTANLNATKEAAEPVLAAANEASPTGYMVLIKQPESADTTQELVDRLNAAGVSDFVKVGKGNQKKYISLGVYSKQANAEKRIEMLDQLGFTPFTYPLYQ